MTKNTDSHGHARCLERITLDRDSSVLSEHRRVGSGADDFAERYAAEYIDPETYLPVSAVAHYTIGGSPLMWFNPARTAVVVNAAVLSELTVVEAMRMEPGTTQRVGRLTELGMGKIAGRELTKFLLDARAIATYVHLGSTLCLVEERESNGGYEARFTGEHTYFTNEKQTEPLAFSVTIDSGVIEVRATDAGESDQPAGK